MFDSRQEKPCFLEILLDVSKMVQQEHLFYIILAKIAIQCYNVKQ